MRKGFTKIPQDLHATVWGWHIEGLSYHVIVDRLAKDHNVIISRKSLTPFIAKLRDEKEKQVSAVLAEKAHEGINKDYSDLGKMEARLERIASRTCDPDNEEKYDPYLFLKVVDRQTKIKQLKLAIAATNKEVDPEQQKQTLLDGLLSSLGRK